MAQATDTFVLQGGLDLVSPAIALPSGRAIAALNYEPEARGYRRIGGYERFSGQPSPSLGANQAAIDARRAAIAKPPGDGPVRGVVIYEGAVYCFRDLAGNGQMFKSTPTGWEKQEFGHTINFTLGTAEFMEGAVLAGATSAATATIERVILQSGQWDGTAAGYMVVSDLAGTFLEGEIGSGSETGSATVQPANPVFLVAGGHYDFTVHNFYGATKRPRLYGVNGVGPGFEWDGEVFSPIRTGNPAGTLDEVLSIVSRNGSTIVSRNGSTIIGRGDHDKPTHVGQYSNHLFLSFNAGSLIHSGVGEPLDFRAVAGAGEITFGGAPTGILSSVTTSLVIFGQSRVEYMLGNDSSNFEMKPISDAAGAVRWSAQMAGEAPIYLDEGGLRKLSTTAAFGDWRMGTISQLVEPLFRAKRDAGVTVAASLKVKGKDQYRLFFTDGTGIILYLGRKNPEIMPIRLPSTVMCACSGEMSEGAGERMFIGCEDGHVYEIDKGPSFDGGVVQAYIRLAWNNTRAPSQEKRFIKATVETDSVSDMAIGVTYHVDYSATANLAGELHSYAVPAGSPAFMPIADFNSIDWQQPSAGLLDAYLDGLGRNIAITLVTEHTNEEPHTLAALTMNYSPRRQIR